MGSLAQSVAETKHQPIGVEGDIGMLVSPEAQVGAPGAATAQTAPFSTVRQTVTVSGLGADDVRLLLDPVFEGAQQERELWTGLAGSILEGAEKEREALLEGAERERETLTGLASEMQAASARETRQLGGIIEATKAPALTQAKAEQASMWAIAAVIVIAFVFLGGK